MPIYRFIPVLFIGPEVSEVFQETLSSTDMDSYMSIFIGVKRLEFEILFFFEKNMIQEKSKYIIRLIIKLRKRGVRK